ncbi:DUF488 domain-containing protein [Paenibacillus sp. YN15]|uniref:DUF488 domain-containing protein n=1 Tax=Paenibacillus sp. YN15 TaxID=1742774 RepID=UPI000DCE66FF|nr:DUF488 domain-containing protein [Paenibacillus sp. YN15]RAU95329.1 hypothetical protein DQG13_22490 [Paenibacillus sp. YN15]
MLQIKRIYEPPSIEDGKRILVDRLWPRGVTREAACLDLWMKDIAPSAALRKSFNHQPEKFAEFTRFYREELQSEGAQLQLDQLCGLIGSGPVTLVYAAKSAEHNHALVLKQFLEERMG